MSTMGRTTAGTYSEESNMTAPADMAMNIKAIQ